MFLATSFPYYHFPWGNMSDMLDEIEKDNLQITDEDRMDIPDIMFVIKIYGMGEPKRFAIPRRDMYV